LFFRDSSFLMVTLTRGMFLFEPTTGGPVFLSKVTHPAPFSSHFFEFILFFLVHLFFTMRAGPAITQKETIRTRADNHRETDDTRTSK